MLLLCTVDMHNIMFMIQIFEWCHFVSTSGLLPRSDEGPSEAAQCGTSSTLTAGDLEQLHGTYVDLIPRYKYLCEAYNKAEQKAKNSRRKSTFPSRKEWMPPFPLTD